MMLMIRRYGRHVSLRCLFCRHKKRVRCHAQVTPADARAFARHAVAATFAAYAPRRTYATASAQNAASLRRARTTHAYAMMATIWRWRAPAARSMPRRAMFRRRVCLPRIFAPPAAGRLLAIRALPAARTSCRCRHIFKSAIFARYRFVSRPPVSPPSCLNVVMSRCKVYKGVTVSCNENERKIL